MVAESKVYGDDHDDNDNNRLRRFLYKMRRNMQRFYVHLKAGKLTTLKCIK